jgi:hypothetical protein
MIRSDFLSAAGDRTKGPGLLTRRLPSSKNILFAYLACLFPIQVWSIYNLLKEVPAWYLQMNVWDLIGAVSYTQMFVLFESVVIFLPFIVLSALPPANWFRDKFVALSTGIVFLSAVWFIFAHINDLALRYWGLRHFLPWIVLFFFSQIILFSLIHSSQKIETAIVTLVDRVAVLSALYLSIDLVSVLIVVIRNV